MNAIAKNLKQWWLPSLILFLAILFLSFLLPNLIYPASIPRNDEQQVVLRTPTRTASPTVALAMITPARINENTGSPAIPLTSFNQNCTYSIYYWRINPHLWLAENILIGRLSYTKEEAVEILAAESDDLSILLLKQFFAALLNTLKGADSSSIEPRLIQASDWLGGHSLGVSLTESEQQEVAALVKDLENFNSGLTGPGQCEDEPPTPTPLPVTATDTPTVTPTRTRTPFPVSPPNLPPAATQPGIPGGGSGETPEPTEEPTEPGEPTAGPTDTPEPTAGSTDTSPPPTDEPLPPPTTEPPSPPTDEPLPTPTQAPLPTEPPPPTEPAAPTDVPAPTQEPEPTQESEPTEEPTPGGEPLLSLDELWNELIHTLGPG